MHLIATTMQHTIALMLSSLLDNISISAIAIQFARQQWHAYGIDSLSISGL